MLANTIQSLHITNEQVRCAMCTTAAAAAMAKMRIYVWKKEKRNSTIEAKKKKRETLYDLSGLARFIQFYISTPLLHAMTLTLHSIPSLFDCSWHNTQKMEQNEKSTFCSALALLTVLSLVTVSTRFILAVSMRRTQNETKYFIRFGLRRQRSLSVSPCILIETERELNVRIVKS